MADGQRLALYRLATQAFACDLEPLITSVCSPHSHGMGESLVRTIKCNDVDFMPKPEPARAMWNLVLALEYCDEHHPHSALKYRSPREFRRRQASSKPSVSRCPKIRGAFQIPEPEISVRIKLPLLQEYRIVRYQSLSGRSRGEAWDDAFDHRLHERRDEASGWGDCRGFCDKASSASASICLATYSSSVMAIVLFLAFTKRGQACIYSWGGHTLFTRASLEVQTLLAVRFSIDVFPWFSRKSSEDDYKLSVRCMMSGFDANLLMNAGEALCFVLVSGFSVSAQWFPGS